MPRGGAADSRARSRQGGGHGRAHAHSSQVLRQRFNEPAAHRGVLVVRSVSLIAGYLALGLRAVPHSCGSDSRARSIRDCRPAWKPVPLPTAVRYCWQAKAQAARRVGAPASLASPGMRRKPRGDVLGCRFSRRAVVDLLDEGRLSLNLAHPPSGGTIPVNTEFAILGVAAGSPAQPAAPPRERRGR
jgi:hypothetical protein